jgi:hypothetical protein
VIRVRRSPPECSLKFRRLLIDRLNFWVRQRAKSQPCIITQLGDYTLRYFIDYSDYWR